MTQAFFGSQGRYAMGRLLQRAVTLAYPPECLLCRSPVGSDFGLCPGCLSDTPFITGPVCDCCGLPQLVATDGPQGPLHCDDCRASARPWQRGRALMRYRGAARRFVLALKHGDRLDLARAAGPWMAQAARPLITDDPILVPVPLHRWRLLHRRYNQAAELARWTARALGVQTAPDALRRDGATAPLDGLSRDQRMTSLRGRIQPNGARATVLKDRNVLLVDDVMTSGATLTACAQALARVGVRRIDCLVLARVERDDPAL